MPAAFWISLVSVAISAFVLYASRLAPARLKLAAEPPSFGVTFHGDGQLAIRFPLVIENRGARTGVVGGLRFAVPAAWSSPQPYAFAHSVWEDIHPGEGTHRFFQPMPVRGGEAILGICEFNVASMTADNLQAGTYEITLETPRAARRGDSIEWRTLGQFHLVVTEHERVGFDYPCAHFNGFRDPAEA